MPTAAMSSGPTSPMLVQGKAGVGTPWGREPTVFTPSSASPRAAETIVAPTTATSTAGTTAREPRQHEQDEQTGDADGQRRRVGLVETGDERPNLVDEVVGVGREAEQLGKLADDDGDAETVHVADLDLLGEQVGDEAELAEPEPDLDEADEERHHPGEGDDGRRVAAGHERHDGGEDERRDRRVGPQDQHTRGTEDGVGYEAGDGRVQAGDGRQAGQLGVGHALGHEDRGQDHTRHEVRAQPSPLVGTHDAHAGDPAFEASGYGRDHLPLPGSAPLILRRWARGSS